MFKKILYYIKFLNAKYHLRFKCPNCPKEVRKKRDIHNKGECYWYSNWKKGNYDLPFYHLYKLKKR